MSHKIIEQLFNNYDWPNFDEEEWRGYWGIVEDPDGGEAKEFTKSSYHGWQPYSEDTKIWKILYRDDNAIIIQHKIEECCGLIWRG